MSGTTIHTETLYKIREFRANGEVFSTFGSYTELGNKFHGAVHALNEVEAMQHRRPADEQHTFKIIKEVTKTKEFELD